MALFLLDNSFVIDIFKIFFSLLLCLIVVSCCSDLKFGCWTNPSKLFAQPMTVDVRLKRICKYNGIDGVNPILSNEKYAVINLVSWWN